MDNFDDHFLSEAPIGINFDEEPKFFDPEAAQEDFLHPQPVVEESIGLVPQPAIHLADKTGTIR